ncbi:MAG: hypothetical protein HCA25_00510 (plasmid) [Dolichospermum sp. DET50]|nr:hypothetical protein [Dolichospermum sp. DET66]MBS3035984.1 hypothetical protein [Dolichospermum sp. DET67]MBS3041152.1 hypothetical protein [Dolichospermum sp. DET50]QSX70893.1 MAG: hypothetical protein EZY12_27235 [Dolichospermum sp. DET69]
MARSGLIANCKAFKQYLIDHELFFHLKNHQQEVEKKLKIKLALDNDTYAVRELKKESVGVDIAKLSPGACYVKVVYLSVEP